MSEDKLEPKPQDTPISEALKHAEKVVKQQEAVKRAKEERRKGLVELMKDVLAVVEEAAPNANEGQKYVLLMVAMQELTKPLPTPMPSMQDIMEEVSKQLSQIIHLSLPQPVKLTWRGRIVLSWRILTKGKLR
jgi:chemotaxis regulatin CheY-phosphate phosphatase CheZ